MSKYPAIPTIPVVVPKNYESVSDAIASLEALRIDTYEYRPIKPSTATKEHTSAAMRAIADALEAYEFEKSAFDAWNGSARNYNASVDATIENFIKNESGLNTSVPEPYRANVWRKAWQDVHSGGYYEVYQQLCELVDIFE